ncbi:MAG TPA: hypothetical protein VKQ52_01455, partial [Puia sp.]|nr:hypothetical protein [Puia sp.]
RLLSESYILWENSTYDRASPDPRFVDLVRTANSRVLTRMLYSPYYYYAINAMEALTYMAATRQLTLAPALRDRIDRLRTPNLKTTDQQIIEKYRTALTAH